jgi:hypothetical protein
VDVYGKWPVSTRFGRVSVDKFFYSYHNVNVTNLKLTDYTKSYDYINGAGQRVKVLRMSDGRKVTIHNSQTRTTVGPKGLVGSIVGAGLIDAAFPLYGDWASGLCLSRNQKFWRANVALQFGLVTGAVGAAFTVGLVAFGVPALAAGVAGFGVSWFVGEKVLGPHKERLVNKVSAAAGR